MALYFRNTGSTDWETASNWSLTDGGGATGTVPTSADDVFFTSNSGSATCTITNKTAKTLTTTGFSGSINCTTVLTISGSITLSSTTTISGIGALGIAATATLTRNSASITVQTFRVVAGSSTVTFADAWSVKDVLLSGASVIMNGSTLNVSGNLTLGQITAAGTTNIELNGTGSQTWSGNFVLKNNLTINKGGGTFTISGPVSFNSATLTWTAGTTATSGSTLIIPSGGTTTTLNTVGSSASSPSTTSSTGINFNSVTTGGTITLTSDLCVTNQLNLSTNTALGGASYTAYVSGALVLSATNTASTATIKLVGTGGQTWSGNFLLANNFIIDKPSGAFTVSGSVTFGGGKTLTYVTAGSVVTTSSVLTTQSCSLDTSGMAWSNVNCAAAFTRTLLSDLYCFQFTVSGLASTINGFNVYISGNLAFNTTTATVSGGTTNFHLVGTGNWSHGSTGRFSNNLTINTAGTITCTTNPVYISGGTFTYTAGTIVNPHITFAASSTINASGFTWGTIRFNTGTYTFNQDFNCDTFNANTATTFTFTSATTKTINANAFSFSAGNTVNLKAGMIVNIATQLTLGGIITSTTAANAFVNCLGAQSVSNVTSTWINSAGGYTIINTGGTNTNTTNWTLTNSQMLVMF